jgi:hypothetical protein
MINYSGFPIDDDEVILEGLGQHKCGQSMGKAVGGEINRRSMRQSKRQRRKSDEEREEEDDQMEIVAIKRTRRNLDLRHTLCVCLTDIYYRLICSRLVRWISVHPVVSGYTHTRGCLLIIPPHRCTFI